MNPASSNVSSPKPETSREYSPEIDGLRAVAVLAVIINHIEDRLLPSGHLGVDIFFVISGYVITASLARRSERSFVELLAGFYLRRIKRLVPALAVSVLVTGFVECLFDPQPGTSLTTGIAALLGVSNIFLYTQATDYFGDAVALNFYTHTWSLGVEEQYYLTFPLVVWLTGLGRRANGLSFFAWVVGLSSIAALALFVYLSDHDAAAAFFLMPARLWELGTGCLVYVLIARSGVATAFVRRMNPLAPLCALLLVLCVPAEFSALSTVAAVALTALVLLALRRDTLAYAALSSRGAVYVGQTSYSLYLWHWGVVALSHWTIGVHWWSVPFQCGLMFLLAHVSYRHVERPLRSATWAPTRRRTIAYGLVASAVAALALAALGKPLKGTLYTGSIPQMAAYGVRSLTEPYRIPGAHSEWTGTPCVLSENSEVGRAIPIDGCTLGEFDTAARRVLVVGNSFSVAFVAAFDDLVLSDGYAVTVTSSFGAAVAPQIENTGPAKLAKDHYWSQAIPSLESRLRPGDWVFAVNDLADYSPADWSAASDATLQSLAVSLRSWSARLAGRGVRLAFLHGGPFARDALCPPEAAMPQWFAPLGGPCRFLSKEATLARRQTLDATLSALAKENGITVVDLMDVFCPDDVCDYDAKDGQLLYRDFFSHPSVEAARLSGPVIRSILTRAPESGNAG